MLLLVPLPDREVFHSVEICFLENLPLTFTLPQRTLHFSGQKHRTWGHKLVSATDLETLNDLILCAM